MTTQTTSNNNVSANTNNTNGNLAIDLSAVEFTSLGRREKGSDMLDHFKSEIFKKKAPEAIEMVKIKGAPSLVFSKIGSRVRVHAVKGVGLNMSVYEIKGKEIVNEVKEAHAPAEFLPAKRPSTAREERSIYSGELAADGTPEVLRQAPIGKTTPAYILELEVLANEFVVPADGPDFGIHFRAAMSKGVPKHLMMTVYTNGVEKEKAASPKGVKINFLGNPEKLEEWLEKVQSVYEGCVTRLLDEVAINHESGFSFDRRQLIENNKLVIKSSKKFELTSELLDTLKRLQESIK